MDEDKDTGVSQCAGEWKAEVIEQLIEWVTAYQKRRWARGIDRREEEDVEALSVISALAGLWEKGLMPEKQPLFFERTFGLCGCASGVCGGGCDGC